MKVNTIQRNLALAITATACGLALLAPAPAWAHDGECPFCALKLVQNTQHQDNEVVVKFGNKKIEYRCVFCIFADQDRYKTDLLVYAPTEKKGEPVVLKRTAGKWSGPEGAVFLNQFKKHVDCSSLSRAFSSRKAFDEYVQHHKVADAKPLTLDQMLKAVKDAAKG